MWRRIGKTATITAVNVVLASLLVLPAAGQTRTPPQDDGSTDEQGASASSRLTAECVEP